MKGNDAIKEYFKWTKQKYKVKLVLTLLSGYYTKLQMMVRLLGI